MSRRRQRFYLDTSVLGGCFDREFEDVSRALVRDAEAGRFQPVLSEVIAAEVSLAPEPVRDVYAHRSLQIYSPREVIFHGNDEN